ncbi:tRNA-splicing endonuclease subunit Sen15 [Plectosphaerella plurivora]|uniref:tRNA-splicing endonuclease subunit Sen15 n=1 Tax=Plectosphaerella plurivora TaxID=936078 RepID=A0A9P8UY36_9PEZI|nr:tRNA-splicing endonuclease subunit Sen15 [Plectosphaerella plurivora]
MDDIQVDFEHLASSVAANLTNQHDWTHVIPHRAASDATQHPRALRPLLCGLPPRRLYIHPDEQVAVLQSGAPSSGVNQDSEAEWVLPVHIKETLSLADFTAIFDSIETLPPLDVAGAAASTALDTDGRDWRGSGRHKRILLAVVHDDSTVSYYIMHDGIVKPRQN